MALMAAVVTGAVVLAFCIPLSLFVRSVAYDRAIDGADLQARTLAAELVTVTAQATVLRLTQRANVAARSTPAAVYLADGHVVGAPGHLPQTVPAIVRAGRTATIATVQGGRDIWEPVRGRSAAVAVVVNVPPDLLTKGVAWEWTLLFGGGALLVLIAIALADWLGRTIVRPISSKTSPTGYATETWNAALFLPDRTKWPRSVKLSTSWPTRSTASWQTLDSPEQTLGTACERRSPPFASTSRRSPTLR